MTFDDISRLYRDEMNSHALLSVREDLYPAMAALCISLEKECSRQYATNPGSIEWEGAEHRKKSAKRLCNEIVRIRTTKVCNIAFQEAMGAKGLEKPLVDEEEEYYLWIKRLTRDQMNTWRRAI